MHAACPYGSDTDILGFWVGNGPQYRELVLSIFVWLLELGPRITPCFEIADVGSDSGRGKEASRLFIVVVDVSC
jgi:hypothetical protein